MSRVGWGSKLGRRKNIWEDLRQAEIWQVQGDRTEKAGKVSTRCSQGGSLGWTAQGMQGP